MRWRFSCQFAIITNMLFDRAAACRSSSHGISHQTLKKGIMWGAVPEIPFFLPVGLCVLSRHKLGKPQKRYTQDGLYLMACKVFSSLMLSNPSREDPMKNNLNSRLHSSFRIIKMHSSHVYKFTAHYNMYPFRPFCKLGWYAYGTFSLFHVLFYFNFSTLSTSSVL